MTAKVEGGQWVGDIVRPDAPIAVTADVPVGGDILQLGTNFDSDYSPVGGFGFVTGGLGLGQGFIITEKLADNSVRVQLINNATQQVKRDGFETALDATSRVVFMYPGVVGVGVVPGTAGRSDNSHSARGVAQVSGEDNEFGWVQQSGVGIVRVAAAIPANALADLNLANGGLFTHQTGVAAGRSLQVETETGQISANSRILAEIDIVNTARQWIGGGPAARAVGAGPEAIS